MAEELRHGEFWLPPEFLTDDDIIMDFKRATQVNSHNREMDSVFHLPYDYPSGFSSLHSRSGFSSPVESMVSSESEEEDYLAGLSQQMANSNLLEDSWKTEAQKSWGISVSPQSTLCGCKQGFSMRSPNCASQVSSPPAAAAGRKDVAWDLLHSAAGEVARMRMIEDANECLQNRRLNSISPQLDCNPNLGFRSNHPIAYQQLQIAKFQQLKRQQMLKQAIEAQSMASSPWPYQKPPSLHVVQPRERNVGRPADLSPSAWPTLQQSVQAQQQQTQQQQPGSGMRAFFLEKSGSERKIGGTGVFLPRRVGNPSETRKKTGCSTVLLPDRLVQALNLNLEALASQPQLESRFNGVLNPDFDSAPNYRNSVLPAQQQQQQKGNLRPLSMAAHSDLRLPQEWTY